MTLRRAGGLTALAALFGLTGCLGSDDTDGPVGTSPFWLNVSAPKAIRADGVTIAGPKGFCIDPGATQAQDNVRFALLGSCASLANSATHGAPRRNAVLSASVGPTGGMSVTRNADALVGLLSGPDGAALLADQQGSSVSVSDVSADEGVVIVRASDPSLTSGRNLQSDYWRGFFDLGGRVVTLSVFSLPGRQGLSESAGRSLLLSFVAAMRQANAEAPPSEGAAES